MGLQTTALEPMSSPTEPPATPDEIDDFIQRLNSGDLAAAPIYLCSDVSHGLADPMGAVVHSHMEIFEHAIPWMWEFHLKNTDARFESTFGFRPAARETAYRVDRGNHAGVRVTWLRNESRPPEGDGSEACRTSRQSSTGRCSMVQT